MEEKENKKTIRTFAAASFLNDFGSDIIYPIWPLFLTTVLGANMAILGFVDGLGDALVSISQAVSGYLSDKFRRRKVFVWTGYLFGAASRIGYAFSTVWEHIIPFRILDRAGKMRGAPRDAIIADASTNQNRGRHFGLLRAMDNLGAVCGIIFCIICFWVLNIGYRELFFFAAVPSVIGAMLVILLIKERKLEKKKIFKGLSFKDLNRNFKMFLLLSALFALGSFSYSFLLIYAKQFGFEVIFVPVLYLVFTLFAAIFSYPFGRLADRIGRKLILFVSYLFWGAVCLIFIFLQSYWLIVFTFVLYGLHRAALEPVQKTFVAELAPAEYRASSLGGYQMVIGLCALPASLIAGLLWDSISIETPFYLSLGLTIVSSFLLLLFVKEKRPTNQR
ncbi:MAG: MFS transporter [Candidatus Thermoplasmatota archaeon]|nr:MFS transporter [Candidatus Thermoplasmatota archaeon]